MSLTYRLKALTKIADRLSSELSRDKLGVPYPEASIIGVVGTFGAQTIMDISRRSNLDKSQTSRTVEALLAKSVLVRDQSPVDGRSVIISLTPEGKKIFKKVAPTMYRRDQDLYRALSEQEMEALRYLLDKLLASHGWNAA
jgi:DNA-binding MarR family transcriptional regulator